ncbi:DUF2905 domain-containing protein [Desulfoplanes formicivorans]|uniref:DUF2905 domain-containing protein n=1 Tax=Desulfoplanes formicivorans TaxID=1592317 RepID=A0A194AIU6_9BACT|nr:DUF2905 domain-containing protein [Desulfoplanes formicivorans]GAU09155.1 hypothetical protein DPF_1875 [Desulfoplanes formicivorans]
MQRTLIIMGVIIVILGLAWPLVSKLPLGRLPGDILINRENVKIWFPITTSLVISVVASLIFWLMKR